MLGNRGLQGEACAWRRGYKISATTSPPQHALGCHRSLGAPHPRQGISLTLLHCSCCGVGDTCGTEGCCPGWQRRLRGRGFLLSIDPSRSGPKRGSSTCSKSLLLPHCPTEALKGQHSAVQPCARIRPQHRGSPSFPISEGFKCSFLQRVPGHAVDNRTVLTIDTSREESVSPAGRCQGDVAQWQSACSACERSWVQCPASPGLLLP